MKLLLKQPNEYLIICGFEDMELNLLSLSDGVYNRRGRSPKMHESEGI